MNYKYGFEAEMLYQNVFNFNKGFIIIFILKNSLWI